MTGLWSIIVPEAGSNIVWNPSAEVDNHNFAGHNFGTVTRDPTYARRGNYCYLITAAGTNDGIALYITGAANAIHNVTFYARGNASTATLQVSMNAFNWNTASVVGGSSAGWIRYNAQIPAAQANGSSALLIRNTANENWRVDCVQCEPTSGYYTTYFDGDLGSLYRWTGERGGSTSSRSAQARDGGREQNFDVYGIRVRQTTGSGFAQIVNNAINMSLQPGAVFQNTRILARKLILTVDLHAASLATLHGRRQDLIDLLKPDAVRGAQPVIIGYNGTTGRTIYGAFRYASGLEMGSISGGGQWIESNGAVKITLFACDPYFYEDDQSATALAFTATVANFNYVGARLNGQWAALGTGLSAGTCYTIAADERRGRVWVAGKFTTANGVTVNNIAYWNGTTFIETNAAGTHGVAVSSVGVRDLAIAPNGDVWVVGDLTAAGGAATVGVARWNNATDTWTCFNLAVGSGTTWYSVAIDSNGNVYIAGDITNWNGIAAADYIAKYDGATWSAVGTSPFAATDCIIMGHSLAIDLDGNLIAGGYNTAAGTALRKFDGTTWTILGSTNAANKGIYAILVQPDNTYIVGGLYSTIGGVTAANIALWTGAAFRALGSGVNDAVYGLARTLRGEILATGGFTTGGGSTSIARIGVWTGSVWTAIDMIPPGAPAGRGIAVNREDWFIGNAVSGSATAAGVTTVTNPGTTSAFPYITITGPTTASTSCRLQWLENESTGERLYFNLSILAGETVVIDLAQGSKRVVSEWRGTIADEPLSMSDFAAWHLLPGSNVIATFITGTTTGVTATIHVPVRHASIDGPA